MKLMDNVFGPSKKFVCTQCGYHAERKRVTKGSLVIELVMWLAFVFPGIIYSLWRMTSKYWACQSCGSDAIVPDFSPKGRQILDLQRATSNWTVEAPTKPSISPKLN